MIVRSFAKDTSISFDFFNDYFDTHCWLLKNGHRDAASVLDARRLTETSLRDGIMQNQRRAKYKRLIRSLLRRYYDYSDAGKLDKYNRILTRCEQLSKGK